MSRIQEQSTAIPHKAIGAVVATGIMSFCGVIVETAMNITFPALMSHFGIGTSSVQWMTTLYLLVVASITPLSAALKRRFRSRTLFLCANLLFLAGLVIDALAPVFPLLLLGRAIQGLGTSIALPLMFNIILQQVPTKRIGTMMGVGTLITAIGPAVGPTFGGLVATTIGWRLVVLPGAAIRAVLAPLSGRLYDQLGPRIPIISGSLVGPDRPPGICPYSPSADSHGHPDTLYFLHAGHRVELRQHHDQRPAPAEPGAAGRRQRHLQHRRAVRRSHRQQPGGHHRRSRPGRSRRPASGHNQWLAACPDPAIDCRHSRSSADPSRPRSLS